MFKQLTWKQLKELRKKQWILQGKKCAVLQKEIDLKDATMDHKHKKKDEEIGYNGAGLLRGVLDFRVNSFEGRAFNWYKRAGLKDLISFPDLLIRLGIFLKKPTMPPIYIHPSEKSKPKKFGKRKYNKLKKEYLLRFPKKKFPLYPKSKKITKAIEKIMKEL